jgi:hypothetical protein
MTFYSQLAGRSSIAILRVTSGCRIEANGLLGAIVVPSTIKGTAEGRYG